MFPWWNKALIAYIFSVYQNNVPISENCYNHKKSVRRYLQVFLLTPLLFLEDSTHEKNGRPARVYPTFEIKT
jgi:hypothetical protein